MIVFTDFHHASLYTSLQLLFEKRLGGTLLRPIGEEWFKEGYWKLAEPYGNDPGTIAQFLRISDIPYQPKDGSRPLNVIKEENKEWYLIKGLSDDEKAVTLEQFKEIKFDYIIASYFPHYQTFTELQQKYQPQAKVICQMGNNWLGMVDWRYVKNLLASIGPVAIPGGVNALFYHQEFDTNIFKNAPPYKGKAIRSFVNTLNTSPLFGNDWATFLRLEQALPEFKFTSYGSMCRDGVITGDEEVAKAIHNSSFVFHLKTGGDGYGHIIHNAFACGRPPIVNKSQYTGCLAESLMIDNQTCIDLESGTEQDNIERIRQFSQPGKHNELCKNAYNKFKEIVNFDEEFKKIKQFLENLL